MPTYKCKEGQNAFTDGGLPDFLKIGYNRTRIGWWGVFTESCRYDIRPRPANDQHDRNKFAGMVFGSWPGRIVDPHRDSVMCGWYYWPDNDTAYLTTYHHIGRDTDHGVVMAPVKIKERFAY